MKFVIVTGGTPPSKKLLTNHLQDSDTLIGVDGAADVLSGYGVTADILIGDFDTADERSIHTQQNKGAKVIRLAVEKDETDTHAAVNYAIKHGATSIVMLGALGTRADHTQSNIMLLVLAHQSNVDARIIDENNELLVCSDSITLSRSSGQTISILPLTGEICVTATNLYYPLDSLVIGFGTSRGISNVMTDKTAQISVSGACALIIIANSDQ